MRKISLSSKWHKRKSAEKPKTLDVKELTISVKAQEIKDAIDLKEPALKIMKYLSDKFGSDINHVYLSPAFYEITTFGYHKIDAKIESPILKYVRWKGVINLHLHKENRWW